MKTKKIRYVFLITIFLLIACLFYTVKSVPSPKEIPSSKLGNRTSAERTRVVAFNEKLNNISNVKIEFHGNIVDEKGVAVSGAVVNYRVAVSTLSGMLFQPTTYNSGIVTSDYNGMFTIEGQKGTTLLIDNINKSGYRDPNTNGAVFSYYGTPEVHDSSKVIEFSVISNDVPRARKIATKNLSFAWNQGEVIISPKWSLGKIHLTPSRIKLDSQLQDFTWKIIISMDDADLIRLGGARNRFAPTTGYKSLLEYGAQNGDLKWNAIVSDRIAFKSKSGQYGVITVTVYPEREDFGVNGSMEVWLNESGNRNLD